jgi:hypothetical protein
METKDEDIYNTFITYAMEIRLPLHKLFAIATDGAPGMLGSINGFIALCKKDETFITFLFNVWFLVSLNVLFCLLFGAHIFICPEKRKNGLS